MTTAAEQAAKGKTSLADRTDTTLDFDRTKVKKLAQNAGREVREFLHDKTEKAAHYRQEAETSISAHPLRSVAIASGIGMILGALFLRRK